MSVYDGSMNRFCLYALMVVASVTVVSRGHSMPVGAPQYLRSPLIYHSRLGDHVIHTLARAGLVSVGEVQLATEDELLNIPLLGKRTLKPLFQYLKEHQRPLGQSPFSELPLLSRVRLYRAGVLTLPDYFARASMLKEMKVVAEDLGVFEGVWRYRMRAQQAAGSPSKDASAKSHAVNWETVMIADVSFSPRLERWLRSKRVNTVGDILDLTEGDLLHSRNVGPKSLEELNEFLWINGLALKGSVARVDSALLNRIEEFWAWATYDVDWPTLPIEAANFSARLHRSLIDRGFKTLGDVLGQSEDEIYGVRGMNPRTLNELQGFLKKHDLALRSDVPAPVAAVDLSTPEAKRARAEKLAYRFTREDLSVRAFNPLHNHGIETLGALIEYSGPELERIPSFGRVSLNEVNRFLEERGLALRKQTTRVNLAPPSQQAESVLRRFSVALSDIESLTAEHGHDVLFSNPKTTAAWANLKARIDALRSCDETLRQTETEE